MPSHQTPAKRAREAPASRPALPKGNHLPKARGQLTRYLSKASGFPRTLDTTMIYQENYIITWTGGNIITQVFTCNGMYDVDITGAGHQPLYFDQLSAVYNHWIVTGSKCEIQVVPAASTTTPSSVTMYVDDDATGSSPLSARMEASGSQTVVLGPGGNGKGELFQTFSAVQNFGGSVLSDPAMEGTSAGNPSELMYFLVTAGALDGSTAGSVSFNCKVTYRATWQELKSIAGS